MRSSVPISIALVFAFCAPTLAQQIIYVDINADGPTEDGLTWCTAFRSLQDGLAATEASNGSVTEIRVANGTYTPDQGLHQTRGDQTASFALVDGVELRGGFAGCGAMHPDQQRPGVFETVLSGDLEANDEAGWRQEQENSFSVVVIDVAPGSASIEGFRVTGATVQVMGFRISDAGIVVVSGHANFRSCMIYDNHSSDLGGGAYIGPYASATVSSCTFADNSAFFGGGIYVNASSDLAITMTDCNFDKNIAFYLGGAACIVNREAQIARCRFFGNRAEVWGGRHF